MKITATRNDPKHSDRIRTDRRSSTRSDDYGEWDSRYMLRTDHDDFAAAYNDMWGGQKAWFKPSCVPITIILLLIVLVVLLPLLDAAEKQQRSAEHNHTINKCHQNCVFTLVETIPDGMSYRNGTTPYPSTYDVWKGMMARAVEKIEIASYYWTLRDSDVLGEHEKPGKWPGSDKGEDIFNDLLNAKSRGLKVKIVQSQPSKEQPCKDTEILARKGAAEVRSINMQRLVGAGILHTKLWIVDRQEVYVGSANTDWRSLAHVKELGLHIHNCSCLLEDYGKIFDAYWEVALPDALIPHKWPADLSTPFNEITPMSIGVNTSEASVYLSSSPPQMCPDGRESDISSIISTIHKADHFIYVAVMDYFPLMIYGAKANFLARDRRRFESRSRRPKSGNSTARQLLELHAAQRETVPEVTEPTCPTHSKEFRYP
uniref:PLD phosphodiesterase domain-containing protein n=2 Tax=Lygus hesperus TaxID=30085 RepID=A0A0K8S4R1_LYGHE